MEKNGNAQLQVHLTTTKPPDKRAIQMKKKKQDLLAGCSQWMAGKNKTKEREEMREGVREKIGG